MGNVAYNLHQHRQHHVEIIVHIDENWGSPGAAILWIRWEEMDGIKSAEFCPLRYHLMLVNYDREVLSSQEVLTGVVSQNIHAELIGPV